MDWIAPKNQTGSFDPPDATSRGKKSSSRRSRTKTLASQITAALAQPLDVWSEAFDQAIGHVKWPKGCSAEATFLFSASRVDQAEVLLRAGLGGRKLASIVADPLSASEPMEQILGLSEQPLEKLAFSWLDDSASYSHAALGVAALAWNLPSHAARDGNDWLENWFQSLTDAVAKYTPDPDEGVLSHLVMQCEMPLLIGVATSASKRVVLAEASQAMDHVAEHLECGQDIPAPWLVHGGSYLRAALASVLRSRILADTLGLRSLYPPQQKALAELLKHAARWSRPNGTPILGAHKTAPKAAAVWTALQKLTRRPKPMLSAMSLSGIGGESRDDIVGKVKPKKLPALTQYSEEASTAVMQCDWRHRAGRVALDFSEQTISLEAVGPKDRSILSGDWTATVKLGSETVQQSDDWGEICWFSDEDADYLELEAPFGESARLQRQIVLFREDKLLLLSDTLLCEKPGEWSVTSTIPTGKNFSPSPAKKTTEIVAGTGKQKSLVLPLFLPEWRRQLLHDSLETEEGLLKAEIHTGGESRCYGPMLISLCPAHASQPFTWRQLTVGEELRIVGRDEACAYRVQIGSDQWLLYRTLAPATRRTALGMHTLSDFFAGRFDPEDGETDTLVEVDPA
ncbi:MAG: hypothetical protein Aurels2KO_05020 [Aureliella sp.]